VSKAPKSITRQAGLDALNDEERNMFLAAECPDLVADITVKRSKDLNRLTRRKRENWAPDVVERDAEASKCFRGFVMATNPSVAHSLIVRLMVARVERNRLAAMIEELSERSAKPGSPLAMAEALADATAQVQAMREASNWNDKESQDAK
jgi:hypothetical protein